MGSVGFRDLAEEATLLKLNLSNSQFNQPEDGCNQEKDEVFEG